VNPIVASPRKMRNEKLWLSPNGLTYFDVDGSDVLRIDTTKTPQDTAMREQFVELIKKARTASPAEKLQIEVALSLVVDELLIDLAN
jgi:hypothetical protein